MEIKNPSSAPNLNSEEQAALLRVARDAVTAASRGECYEPPEVLPGGVPRSAGVFVSLHLGDELRGCIGVTQTRQPLVESTAHCARAAALEDPRFPPLSVAEVPQVGIEISVLGELRALGPGERPRPGIDGVLIEQEGRQGLLLPQVAIRFGWSAERLLSETCRKAELPGDAWTRGARVRVFQAQVFSEEAVT
jgi:AmmeMemoRadiSam system protein A